MADRSRTRVRRRLEDVAATKRVLLLVCLVVTAGTAVAEVPVELYVSPNDDGAGGASVIAPRNSGPHTLAVWGRFQGAGGGSGAISIQDVLLRASGDIVITGFTCGLPECLVGNRSDPRSEAPFPARELVFTAGDDAAASPGLTGSRKVGDLVVNVGAEPGALVLAGGTALDGNAAGDELAIAALPNAGVLLVPAPAGALQHAFAIATLAGLHHRRCGRARESRVPCRARAVPSA